MLVISQSMDANSAKQEGHDEEESRHMQYAGELDTPHDTPRIRALKLRGPIASPFAEDGSDAVDPSYNRHSLYAPCD